MSDMVEDDEVMVAAEPVGATEIDEPIEPMPHTGHQAVDDVLAEVDTLTERPLDEHVAVFTNAHEGLRAALNSGDTGPTEG